MQFVKYGPEVPESLLHAHEDGHVVFFCGAGISSPAGLPLFKGLVDKVYKVLHEQQVGPENISYAAEQFDTCLDQLERRLVDGPNLVRTQVFEALTRNFEQETSKRTHKALLELSRDKFGKTRLVTTNFDRIFERVKDNGVASFSAPSLPIPKKSRWDGIVYLHGLLPAKSHDSSALQQLVLTSGDFGLAYLTEQWAARFVSELFLGYTVCFVGYSLNDPILRYTMDALAADRRRGESTPTAFAFADCKPGQEDEARQRWLAKGVEPIVYSDDNFHSLLHDTLAHWAEISSEGTIGKGRIVTRYATSEPQASSEQDDYVGRMLWALSDRSGRPARAFADHNPVLDLDWLEPIAENLHKRNGPRLPHGSPPPNFLAAEILTPELQNQAVPLFWWLTRHLGDVRLLEHLPPAREQLNGLFASIVVQKLDAIEAIERSDESAEIEAMRAKDPCQIRETLMRKFWRCVIFTSARPIQGVTYNWRGRLKRTGLTLPLRLQLREMLAPRIRIKRVLQVPREAHPECLSRLVDWDIILSEADVRSLLLKAGPSEAWTRALPEILDDVQTALRDVLELAGELGELESPRNPFATQPPSIEESDQNTDVEDWTVLVELLREAWLETQKVDNAKAEQIAKQWFNSQYVTFKRLALFAACQKDILPGGDWVDWLIADEARWLWNVVTTREVMRLFVIKAATLAPERQSQLQTAIILGPPSRMMKERGKPEDLRKQTDWLLWLRLAKLVKGEVELSPEAECKFAELTSSNPDWQLSDDEREEFPEYSISSGADWPTKILPERAEVKWSTAPKLLEMNSFQFANVADDVALWLESIADTQVEDEALFLGLCKRVLETPHDHQPITDKPHSWAINHPVGQVTEAILKQVFGRKLNDDQGLPDDVKPLLTSMCDTTKVQLRSARIILGRYVIPLFRVDNVWTSENLLPLFEWKPDGEEAAGVWAGYLFPPFSHPPLLTPLKKSLLQTASEYKRLQEHPEQFVRLLTSLALEASDGFSDDELRKAFDDLPTDALRFGAGSFAKWPNSTDKRQAYWDSQIAPFWKRFWPKDRSKKTPLVSQNLAMLALEARDAFPSAVKLLGPWLTDPNDSGSIVRTLLKSNLCKEHPKSAVAFLNAIMKSERWVPSELRQCLDAIVEADPSLVDDVTSRRLQEMVNRTT